MFEDFITWAGTQIKLITFYQKKKKRTQILENGNEITIVIYKSCFNKIFFFSFEWLLLTIRCKPDWLTVQLKVCIINLGHSTN